MNLEIKKPKKWEGILSFTALLWAVLLVNIYAGDWFFRWDLTEEGRYTISEGTKQLLEELDDVVYVEVYLDGELNAGFKRLQKAISETLEEFRYYAGARLEYKFIDPYDAPNPRALARRQKELVDRGLTPTYLNETADGARVQKVIFPGAIVSYRGREQAALLLKGNKGTSAQLQLNQSAEGVEYELASAIRLLSVKEKPKVAIIAGHEDLRPIDLQEFRKGLEQRYWVDRIEIGEKPLSDYNAIVMAQPKQRFSEEEVFELDQYVVNGGKALLMIDKVQMNLDSIAIGGTYAFGYDLGIEDWLFRMGIRVNNDLVQDIQAGVIEVQTGNFGNQAQVKPMPWPYYVYLNKFSDHPIVRNMDVVYGKFISTLDTVVADGITKTPLIYTSNRTRIKKVPTMVDLNEMREDMKSKAFQGLFDKGHTPIAYLLEGQFTSLYANQGAPLSKKGAAVTKSGGSKVVVVGDADLIRNEMDPRTGKPEPIDYDKYRRQNMSNMDFVFNALEYLIDEDGIINARKKRVTLRPLDVIRAKEERAYWQVLNIVLPAAAIIGFGIIYVYLRRRKYTS